MEIDWVENCVKIFDDIICNIIGKLFDLLYFIGECDKFCMCFELGSEFGIIDVFISYCGMEEVYIFFFKDEICW